VKNMETIEKIVKILEEIYDKGAFGAVVDLIPYAERIAGIDEKNSLG